MINENSDILREKLDLRNGLYGKSLVSIVQFEDAPDQIEVVLNEAKSMDTLVNTTGGDHRLQHKVISSVFYEPSTRTSCSFHSAALRLGASVMNPSMESSSVKKGETLEDTTSCIACYSDVIIQRHPEKGSAHRSASVANIPVINAGDGPGEHPTQALLDLYTIREELAKHGKYLESNISPSSTTRCIDEAKDVGSKIIITMIGDLKYGRTVHSLVHLLAIYTKSASIVLRYVSPLSLNIPSNIKEYMITQGIEQEEYSSFSTRLMGETDILYVTRIQKERFDSIDEYNKVKDFVCIDSQMMSHAKESMAVLHPLPRVGEISPSVDADPRAAYIRQMKNGMYLRMALLSLILGSK